MNPESFSSDAFFADGFDPVNNPSQQTYGSLGRNALRGPGRANVDLSIAKNTKITETKQLELRFEAFNAFNHAQFTNPTGEINSSQFGVVTNARAARIMQVGAKFLF